MKTYFFIYIFCFSFVLYSQDSLYTKKEILINKGQLINLNSLHRPLFRLNESNRFANYYLMDIHLNDHFNNSFNEKTIPFELIDSLNSENYLQFYRNEVLNTIPYTKVNIIDGDFAFTDVDVSFRQRLSENIGLVMGFNNKESLGNFSGSSLKEPVIRVGLDYFFRKEDKFSLDYLFRRENIIDYGYVEKDLVVYNNSYWKIKDNTDILLSYSKNSTKVFFNYSSQNNFERIKTTDIKPKSYKLSLGYSDSLAFLSYKNQIYFKSLSHKYYKHNYAENGLMGRVRFNSTILNVFGEYRFYKKYFGKEEKSSFVYDADLSMKYTGLEFRFKSSLKEAGSQFYLFEKDTDSAIPDESYLKYYSGKIKSNKNLNPEFVNKFDVIYRADFFQLGLSHLTLLDQIYYNQVHETYLNRASVNSLFLNAGLNTGFWGQNFSINLVHQLRKSSDYQDKNSIEFSHHFKSGIYQSLYLDLRNKISFFYSSNPLLYHRYMNFFDYEKSIKSSYFRYSLLATFKLKTADIILSFDNLGGIDQNYVRGYSGKSLGTKFGVKWVFYY